MNVKEIIKNMLVSIYGSIRPDWGGKVIYYHDITQKYTRQGTPKDLFVQHIDCLKRNGFTIVPRLPQKDKEIMICFDDGWKGIWDERDYLIKNAIFPTVFLIVDFIGKPGYLSIDEVLELQSKGFRFQGHTYSHANVTEISGKQLQHELLDAKKDLSKLLGVNVDEFCFPRGNYSDSLVKYALSKGYKRVYVCKPGSVNSSDVVINRNLGQFCSKSIYLGVLKGGLRLFSRHSERLHHK